MKNLSKKITTLLVFCTLSIVQVSATPITSLEVEKSDYEVSQATEAYTKISCFKSWILSLLNKRDYVVEDSLLNNYMLGSSNEPIKLTKEEEEHLLSYYMYGINDSSIAYSHNLEDASFAADLDDEYIDEEYNNDEEYIFEE